MKLEMFINFDGNCRDAVKFYEGVFKTKVGNLMTYGDAPPNPNYTVPNADRERIMYAGLPVGGMVIMFSDVPSGSEFVQGNNICPTIGSDDKGEITRLYNELKECGEVYMELAPTFFSELFSMVEDKFGIIWQISYYKAEQTL
ncbi:MAG: VOC family protein [Clostridiales bacterium]|nr:VOC family protein [Clostridiales bacterium]